MNELTLDELMAEWREKWTEVHKIWERIVEKIDNEGKDKG